MVRKRVRSLHVYIMYLVAASKCVEATSNFYSSHNVVDHLQTKHYFE